MTSAWHHLRRAPLGLKIVLGVWLLVLALPHLRTRARFAWHSQNAATPSGVFGVGSDEFNAARLAARFPDDATAQKLLVEKRHEEGLGAPVHGSGVETIQAYVAPTRSNRNRNFYEPQKRRIAQMTALVARFPNENWLRADALRFYTSGGMGIEPPQPNVNDGQTRAPWLSRDELLEMRRIAREGANREPQNAFYPWMEALALFALKTPDAAVSALERAGKCTSYNDEAFSSSKRRIALLERVRPLEWEERTSIWSATLFPHYAPMRSAARATCARAKAALDRGDKTEALRIYGALMNAARPMRENSDILIGVLVARAMQSIVWHGAAKDAKLLDAFELRESASTLQEQKARREKRVTAFGDFARANGRPDLATLAVADATSHNLNFSRYYVNGGDWPPLGMARTRAMVQGTWLEGWLLRLAFWGALAWTACAVALRLAARFAFAPRVRRGPMAASIAFMGGATLALLGFYVFQGAGDWLLAGGDSSYVDPYTGNRGGVANIEPYLPYLLLLIWCGPILLAALTGRRRSQARVGRRWSFALPGWDALSDGGRRFALWSVLMMWAASLGVAFNAPRARDFMPWLAIFSTLGLLATVAALKMGSRTQSENAGRKVSRGDKASRDNAEPNVDYAGRWSFGTGVAVRGRMASGALCVGSSVLYLALTLGLWSWRAQTNAMQARQIEIGEVAYIKEQLAQRP